MLERILVFPLSTESENTTPSQERHKVSTLVILGSWLQGFGEKGFRKRRPELLCSLSKEVVLSCEAD